jgi:hypothetical protein
MNNRKILWSLGVLVLTVPAVLAWIGLPFTMAAAEGTLASRGVAGATIERLLDGMRERVLIGTLAAPLLELSKLALLACLCHAAGALSGVQMSWPISWGLAFVSEIPSVAKSTVQSAIVHVRGVGAIHSANDLQPPVGLDLVFEPPGVLLRAVVSFVNPFDLLMIVALVTLVRGRTARRADAAWWCAIVFGVLLAGRVMLERARAIV